MLMIHNLNIQWVLDFRVPLKIKVHNYLVLGLLTLGLFINMMVTQNLVRVKEKEFIMKN